VEAAVKIAKNLLTKAKQDHRDPQLAILDWRNTPTESSNASPVQKLHSRRTRTLLPTAEPLLMPEVPRNVQETIALKRQRVKLYYDRGAKTLPELAIGQPVRMQPVSKDGSWRKATTVSVLGNRPYVVQADDGQMYRRNRRFIRPIVLTELQGDSENQADNNSRPSQGGEVAQPADNATTLQSPTTTSSGRIVKPPNRLKDFVKHYLFTHTQ